MKLVVLSLMVTVWLQLARNGDAYFCCELQKSRADARHGINSYEVPNRVEKRSPESLPLFQGDRRIKRDEEEAHVVNSYRKRSPESLPLFQGVNQDHEEAHVVDSYRKRSPESLPLFQGVNQDKEEAHLVDSYRKRYLDAALILGAMQDDKDTQEGEDEDDSWSFDSFERRGKNKK